MDNIYRLRIFTHISKTLNFTETARQLRLAQPAVSRHIKGLEDELGCILFIRQQKKVLLTEEGKTLLRDISPIISEFDRIFANYSDNKTESAGLIKIGSVAEAGHYIYMDHLINFQKEYPNIQVMIEYGGSDVLQKKVLNGEVDFALVGRVLACKGLDEIPLFKDRAVLVGAKSRKNLDDDLQKISLVKYRENDYYTDEFLKKHFTNKMQKSLQVLGCVSSHESMFEWIIRRDALCVVPKSSFEKSKYKSQLKIFKEDITEQTLYLICLYNAKAELRKKLFLDKMQKISTTNKK